MNKTTIQAPSVFNSDILTCKFQHLEKEGGCFEYSEYSPFINLDCRDGEVTCSESSGGGLSANQADGSDKFFELPRGANKQKTYDFLCSDKVIKLLEIIYEGNEIGGNLNWYLDNDARAASNKLCILTKTADFECDDEEDDDYEDVKILSVKLHITEENTLQANANCLIPSVMCSFTPANCLIYDEPVDWFTDNNLEFLTTLEAFGGSNNADFENFEDVDYKQVQLIKTKFDTLAELIAAINKDGAVTITA